MVLRDSQDKVHYCVSNHSLEKNGKVDWTVILFEVKPEGFFATLQDFEDKLLQTESSKTDSTTNHGGTVNWTMIIMKMH